MTYQGERARAVTAEDASERRQCSKFPDKAQSERFLDTVPLQVSLSVIRGSAQRAAVATHGDAE